MKEYINKEKYIYNVQIFNLFSKNREKEIVANPNQIAFWVFNKIIDYHKFLVKDEVSEKLFTFTFKMNDMYCDA